MRCSLSQTTIYNGALNCLSINVSSIADGLVQVMNDKNSYELANKVHRKSNTLSNTKNIDIEYIAIYYSRKNIILIIC